MILKVAVSCNKSREYKYLVGKKVLVIFCDSKYSAKTDTGIVGMI